MGKDGKTKRAVMRGQKAARLGALLFEDQEMIHLGCRSQEKAKAARRVQMDGGPGSAVGQAVLRPCQAPSKTAGLLTQRRQRLAPTCRGPRPFPGVGFLARGG